MIRYHFDLYPSEAPRDGARLVRFTKLQRAEWRADAKGTGAGRFSIRASEAEAQFLDPVGLQYVRVVEEDTDAATEVVRFGFFIEHYEADLLNEADTRLLECSGAGALAALDRAILLNETYEQDVLGAGAAPPYDDLWRLYLAGTGNGLGAMLYRTVAEAIDPDRDQNPFAFLTTDFDYLEDSEGNAWAAFGGEFTAGVGESVLSVARRLVEIGLLLRIDPDTFTLSAWPQAATALHGRVRDRSGGAWGADVVRFQVPTDATIATGNIKSDLKRSVAAQVRRSMVLAGGQDVYASATDPGAGIVYEGFYSSDAEDVPTLAAIAATQLTLREDAGDTVRLRLRLGNAPAQGHYLPMGHIRPLDIVTLHTGAGAWDYNEAALPVAAVECALRDDGRWDGWAELGDSYASSKSRQFTSPDPAAGGGAGPGVYLCPRPYDVPAIPRSSDWEWTFAANLLDDHQGTVEWQTPGTTFIWVSPGLARSYWTGASSVRIPNGQITPGVEYTFEADVTERTGGGTLTMRIDWINAANGTISQHTIATIAGVGLVSVPLTAPALATGAFIRLLVSGTPEARYSRIGVYYGGSAGSPGDTSLSGTSVCAARGDHNHDHGSLLGLGDDDHPQYATDADLAAHAATSHGGTPAFIGCRLRATSAQSIPHNTLTAVALGAEDYDAGGLHDNATNNSRITVTAAGVWRFTYHLAYAAGATGIRVAQLRINGATIIDGADNRVIGSNALQPTLVGAIDVLLAASDYVELMAFQNQGSALLLTAPGIQVATFTAHYLGAP